jgi:hypothetical protein
VEVFMLDLSVIAAQLGFTLLERDFFGDLAVAHRRFGGFDTALIRRWVGQGESSVVVWFAVVQTGLGDPGAGLLDPDLRIRVVAGRPRWRRGRHLVEDSEGTTVVIRPRWTARSSAERSIEALGSRIRIEALLGAKVARHPVELRSDGILEQRLPARSGVDDVLTICVALAAVAAGMWRGLRPDIPEAVESTEPLEAYGSHLDDIDWEPGR